MSTKVPPLGVCPILIDGDGAVYPMVEWMAAGATVAERRAVMRARRRA